MLDGVGLVSLTDWLRARIQPLFQFASLELGRTLGARQMRTRPHVHTSNSLMVRKARIRQLCDVFCIDTLVQNQHGMDTLLTVPRQAHRGRLANAWQHVEHALHVLRKHVEPFGRDNHLFLASSDEKLSRLIDLSDVPRMEPAVLERAGRLVGRLKVTGRHVLASDENFAIRCDFDLHASNRFADRSAAGLEGMVERDDWRGLCESVTLHHQKPQR